MNGVEITPPINIREGNSVFVDVSFVYKDEWSGQIIQITINDETIPANIQIYDISQGESNEVLLDQNQFTFDLSNVGNYPLRVDYLFYTDQSNITLTFTPIENANIENYTETNSFMMYILDYERLEAPTTTTIERKLYTTSNSFAIENIADLSDNGLEKSYGIKSKYLTITSSNPYFIVESPIYVEQSTNFSESINVNYYTLNNNFDDYTSTIHVTPRKYDLSAGTITNTDGTTGTNNLSLESIILL